MWSREDIKTYAKEFLRKHYWKAFLVCLIALLLSGDGGNSNNQSKKTTNYNQNQVIIEIDDKIPFDSDNIIVNNIAGKIERSPLFFLARGVIPIMVLIFVVLLITVGYAIEVGKTRFFLRGFKEDVSIGNLFSTFNSREYFGIVRTQFLRGLYNLLWFLLLIIPGIIKSYEYSMVPYILAEEPNLPSNEAINRSRSMTEGHKMDMFVLDLSFIGWYILGSLLFGIGGIFVNPYKEATLARLYNILSGNDDLDNDEIDYDIVLE